jgi:hypothetical protein
VAIAIRAVHRQAFDEHGGTNAVSAAVDILQELWKQVQASMRAPVPEVVMRINDRQIRFEHFLAALGKPRPVDVMILVAASART